MPYYPKVNEVFEFREIGDKLIICPEGTKITAKQIGKTQDLGNGYKKAEYELEFDQEVTVLDAP